MDENNKISRRAFVGILPLLPLALKSFNNNGKSLEEMIGIKKGIIGNPEHIKEDFNNYNSIKEELLNQFGYIAIIKSDKGSYLNEIIERLRFNPEKINEVVIGSKFDFLTGDVLKYDENTGNSIKKISGVILPRYNGIFLPYSRVLTNKDSEILESENIRLKKEVNKIDVVGPPKASPYHHHNHDQDMENMNKQ